MQLSDLINLAIAIFTAIAAKAAWDSAKSSHRAVEQANQSAEDSRKIAGEQTKALLTAAKANALASRIAFYNEQIRPLLPGNPDIPKLTEQRNHLAYWLDCQTDALGVGLNHECPLSPYNETIKGRNKPGV
jgi:hypothetical protein